MRYGLRVVSFITYSVYQKVNSLIFFKMVPGLVLIGLFIKVTAVITLRFVDSGVNDG